MALIFTNAINPVHEERVHIVLPTTVDEQNIMPLFGPRWDFIPLNLLAHLVNAVAADMNISPEDAERLISGETDARRVMQEFETEGMLQTEEDFIRLKQAWQWGCFVLRSRDQIPSQEFSSEKALMIAQDLSDLNKPRIEAHVETKEVILPREFFFDEPIHPAKERS